MIASNSVFKSRRSSLICCEIGMHSFWLIPLHSSRNFGVGANVLVHRNYIFPVEVQKYSNIKSRC